MRWTAEGSGHGSAVGQAGQAGRGRDERDSIDDVDDVRTTDDSTTAAGAAAAGKTMLVFLPPPPPSWCHAPREAVSRTKHNADGTARSLRNPKMCAISSYMEVRGA